MSLTGSTVLPQMNMRLQIFFQQSGVHPVLCSVLQVTFEIVLIWQLLLVTSEYFAVGCMAIDQQELCEPDR